MNTDDVVSVLFKRNGSYADCCKYQIFDSNNNLLETRDGDGTGSNGGPENVMGLLACPSGFKCGTYKIEMFDYYGNGWGGSFMQVYINGNPEVIGEFENLSNAWADTEDVSFSVESGDSIDIVWMPDPSVSYSGYYSFIAYKVFDENDSLLAFVETFDTTVLANTYNLLSCPNILPSANFTSTTTSTCSGVVEFLMLLPIILLNGFGILGMGIQIPFKIHPIIMLLLVLTVFLSQLQIQQEEILFHTVIILL